MKPSDREAAMGTAAARGIGRRMVGWGVWVCAALLPIGLLSLYADRITLRSVQQLVEANNLSASATTAELIRRELTQSTGLAQAIAALPDLVEAVERHDATAVRALLRPILEGYPAVDRAFVADPVGVLWSDYPLAPESLGQNFSHRDWYRGLSRSWRPYLSEVYLRQAQPRRLVVAVAVPVRNRRQEVVGALVWQYRLDEITNWLRRIRLGNSGYVFLIDHTGAVVAHPKLDLTTRSYDEYRGLLPVGEALRGQARTARYIDPLSRQEMVASFMPVALARQRWVVVAGQPVAEADAPLELLRVQIGVAAGLLAAVAVAAMVGLGRISERNRRLSRLLSVQNQALEKTAVELQRSNKELEQFAYVASHDLQEPLRSVASFVQLLGQRYAGKLDAEADEFIGFAVEGARRMQSLINDLLAYSRVGTRAKTFEPVDCELVCQTALNNLQVCIQESGATVTHDPLPTVLADGQQLTQLFQNLIANAIKFHGPEPPRVHLAAARQDGSWRFAVQDNGIGIEPEHAERIFEIFQRLHSREKYPGTGIGLAICKKIVERHGGRIWVDSQPGRGAIFYFTLPEAC